MNRKMKLIKQLVETFEKEGKEISHASVMNWISGQFINRTLDGAKYSAIRPSDVGQFFRDFYVSPLQ